MAHIDEAGLVQLIDPRSLFRPPTERAFLSYKLYSWVISVVCHILTAALSFYLPVGYSNRGAVTYDVFIDRVCDKNACYAWHSHSDPVNGCESLHVLTVLYNVMVVLLISAPVFTLLAELYCRAFRPLRRPRLVGAGVGLSAVTSFLTLLLLSGFFFFSKCLPITSHTAAPFFMAALLLTSLVWSCMMLGANVWRVGADTAAEDAAALAIAARRVDSYRARRSARV